MDGTLRRTIDAAKKYVVPSTLDRVDWNAELVRDDALGLSTPIPGATERIVRHVDVGPFQACSTHLLMARAS